MSLKCSREIMHLTHGTARCVRRDKDVYLSLIKPLHACVRACVRACKPKGQDRQAYDTSYKGQDMTWCI